jgi:hypothetical protein
MNFDAHFEEPLPEWAFQAVPEGSIHIMQGALTRDGRRTGNAVITDIALYIDCVRITVVTETGNIIRLSALEFNDQYWTGRWIMKDFPTTESKRAWKEHLDELQSKRATMVY